MQVELIKNSDGKFMGFQLVPDHSNKDDVDKVNEIRNAIYTSMTHRIAYGGREKGSKTCAGKLNFVMKPD